MLAEDFLLCLCLLPLLFTPIGDFCALKPKAEALYSVHRSLIYPDLKLLWSREVTRLAPHEHVKGAREQVFKICQFAQLQPLAFHNL
jgi:hypothetical protein